MNLVALIAAALTTAVCLAAPAHADIPGLAPFVGEWSSHLESVEIHPDGSGVAHDHDFSACPQCSTAAAPITTDEFTLTSVSDGVATGTITKVSNPVHANQIGKQVLAQLQPDAGGGTILRIAWGTTLDQGWPLCNATSSPGQCGA